MDLSLRSVIQESAVIVDRYRTIHPVDPSDVSAVVNAYIQLNGGIMPVGASDKRMLLALCIRIFHPEKLFGTHLRRLRNGIIPALADQLDCKPNYFWDVLSEVVFQYTQYQGFRNEVDAKYQTIINNLKISLF